MVLTSCSLLFYWKYVFISFQKKVMKISEKSRTTNVSEQGVKLSKGESRNYSRERIRVWDCNNTMSDFKHRRNV